MPKNTIDARCKHSSCDHKRHYVMAARCNNCGWDGLLLITNGHTKIDAKLSARCPRCDCKAIQPCEFVEGNGHVA